MIDGAFIISLTISLASRRLKKGVSVRKHMIATMKRHFHQLASSVRAIDDLVSQSAGPRTPSWCPQVTTRAQT